jgi:hypothetical protein
MSNLVMFFLLYGASAALLAFMNRREFMQHPEKAARYAALPIGYKAACWLGVLPLFSCVVFNQFLPLLALPAFFVVESLCVRWYRKAGLL